LRACTLSFPDFKTTKATTRRQQTPKRQRTQIPATAPTEIPTMAATGRPESEEDAASEDEVVTFDVGVGVGVITTGVKL